MRIRRAITVKMILTERTREELLSQCEQSMRQLEIELEQLTFERRKLLHRAEKQGREAIKHVEERLNRETDTRREKLRQLRSQRDHIATLAEGTELVHGQVDGDVEIKVGDSWEELTKGKEIVLKDGFVHEIRGGKDS